MKVNTPGNHCEKDGNWNRADADNLSISGVRDLPENDCEGDV
jgi:hypothetical protein